MKRILFMALVALFVASPVFAQTKAQKKHVKELNKEGWKSESSFPMIDALYAHYGKLANGLEERVGIAYNKKKVNIAKAEALNNAINDYAQEASTFVKGRVASDMSDIDDQEREAFVAGFERLVQAEIKGELKPSVTLIKENEDGTYSVRRYFVLDYEASMKANERALKQALEESKIAKEYGNTISDWINAGFQE